jgi:pilus assembly protein Flp/PilA
VRTRIRKVAATAVDRGASAVEYGLLIAAIAAVIVAVVFGLGDLVRNTFVDTCTQIEAENSPTVQDSVDC